LAGYLPYSLSEGTMSSTQRPAPVLSDYALFRDETLCICREPFLATIEPHGERYSFTVRDLSRERPTIHGSGLSLEKTLAAVTELLDALPAGPEQ
jgi:hypothetical protein